MTPLRVRYNPLFGFGIAAAAMLIFAAGACTSNLILVVLGMVNVVVGLGFLTREWFVFSGTAFEMKNMLGMTVKTHTVDPSQPLEVRANGVWMGDARLFGGAAIAHSKDWEALKVALAARQTEA